MKKSIKYLLLVVSILLLVGCSNKSSIEFKNEYEALNGKTNSSGKVHRTVEIQKNNPYEKVSSSKILEMIKNKETFYVYFGDPLCPWCRSVIEKGVEISKKNNVKKIYYVKIWDNEGVEVLRSKYVIGDDNKAQLVKKGTDDYYKLLEAFDSVLEEYTLNLSSGEKISVGEKRIYAPNFVYVEKGVAKRLVEGISDRQKDSREDLTKEMLKDEEKIFNEFFKK